MIGNNQWYQILTDKELLKHDAKTLVKAMEDFRLHIQEQPNLLTELNLKEFEEPLRLLLMERGMTEMVLSTVMDILEVQNLESNWYIKIIEQVCLQLKSTQDPKEINYYAHRLREIIAKLSDSIGEIPIELSNLIKDSLINPQILNLSLESKNSEFISLQKKEIFETGKELINLMSVKENEDNWEKREKCLQKIKNLCDKESSNDIQEYGQLNFIIPSILESIHSLRTALSITAVNTLHSVVTLSNKYIDQKTAELILKSILKLSAQSKSIIIKMVNEAGIDIINQLSFNPKIINTLLNHLDDKNSHIRIICSKITSNFFKKSPLKIDLVIIEKFLIKGLADACKDVRDVSKELLQYYGSYFPDRLTRFLENLDITTKKSLKNLTYNYEINSQETSPITTARSSIAKIECLKDSSISSADFIGDLTDLKSKNVAQKTDFIISVISELLEPSIFTSSIVLNNLNHLLMKENPAQNLFWGILFEKEKLEKFPNIAILRELIFFMEFDKKIQKIEGFLEENPHLHEGIEEVSQFFAENLVQKLYPVTQKVAVVASPKTNLHEFSSATPKDKSALGWKLFKKSTPLQQRPSFQEYESLIEKYLDILTAFRNGEPSKGPSKSLFRRLIRISRETNHSMNLWDIYFQSVLVDTLEYIDTIRENHCFINSCENSLLFLICLIENQYSYFSGFERKLINILLKCRMSEFEEINASSDQALESSIHVLNPISINQILIENIVEIIDEESVEKSKEILNLKKWTPSPVSSSFFYLGNLLTIRFEKIELINILQSPIYDKYSIIDLLIKGLSNKKTEIRKSSTDTLAKLYRDLENELFQLMEGKINEYQKKVVIMYIESL